MKVEQVVGKDEERDDTLDSECVRENEVQTEAQAEEEAAQEEQSMSMFTRDDEQPNPWSADVLNKVCALFLTLIIVEFLYLLSFQ